MFQDIGVSKDLNEQFKKHLTNSEPLDCEYRVLIGGLFGLLVANERSDRLWSEGAKWGQSLKE